jgi:hypothetical protein
MYTFKDIYFLTAESLRQSTIDLEINLFTGIVGLLDLYCKSALLLNAKLPKSSMCACENSVAFEVGEAPIKSFS